MHIFENCFNSPIFKITCLFKIKSNRLYSGILGWKWKNIVGIYHHHNHHHLSLRSSLSPPSNITVLLHQTKLLYQTRFSFTEQHEYNTSTSWNWHGTISSPSAQKPNQFKPPDWDKVKAAVATILSVQPSDLLNTKIDELKSIYNEFVASRKNKGSAQRECKKKKFRFWYPLKLSSSWDLSILKTLICHLCLPTRGCNDTEACALEMFASSITRTTHVPHIAWDVSPKSKKVVTMSYERSH